MTTNKPAFNPLIPAGTGWAFQPAAIEKKKKIVKNNTKPGPNNGGGGGGSDPLKQLSNITFNLPSHAFAKSANVEGVNNSSNVNKTRARMWFYTETPGSKASSKAGSAQSVGLTTASTSNPLNFNFGFQWMWNPQKFGGSLQVNSSIVPSQADPLMQFNGLFQGMESLTISAKLNRVYDLAQARTGGLSEKSYPDLKNDVGTKQNQVSIPAQILEVETMGTMHDLEYIFRMVNGYGPSSSTPYTNSLGIQTSDISFLAPTVVALQLGPMGYVGWLNSVTWTHNMFTEDMIPIDTDVDFTLSAFSIVSSTGA